MFSTHVATPAVEPYSTPEIQNNVIVDIMDEADLEPGASGVVPSWQPNDMSSVLYLIEVPATIWIPKFVNKYTTSHVEDDDVDDILDYGKYGKYVYKPQMDWSDNNNCKGIIIYNENDHAYELYSDLWVDDTIDPNKKAKIINIIKEYWDYFLKTGAKRTISGYEFGIGTGGSKHFSCRKPSYGPNESKIIMEQVAQLRSNEWIERCEGPWVSMIVLAQKSHQESIVNIEDFIWRICVSYRRLNADTKPFQFLISNSKIQQRYYNSGRRSR